MGRNLNNCLTLRNKSRYDHNSIIGKKEADDVLKIANEMINILDEKLSEG